MLSDIGRKDEDIFPEQKFESYELASLFPRLKSYRKQTSEECCQNWFTIMEGSSTPNLTWKTPFGVPGKIWMENS